MMRTKCRPPSTYRVGEEEQRMGRSKTRRERRRSRQGGGHVGDDDMAVLERLLDVGGRNVGVVQHHSAETAVPADARRVDARDRVFFKVVAAIVTLTDKSLVAGSCTPLDFNHALRDPGVESFPSIEMP